jgi:hypothetical protein
VRPPKARNGVTDMVGAGLAPPLGVMRAAEKGAASRAPTAPPLGVMRAVAKGRGKPRPYRSIYGRTFTSTIRRGRASE